MSGSVGDFPDIEFVVRDLESATPISHVLSGAGGLYIERPQPFLCLYRRPSGRTDLGTDQLLSTQASYLNVQEREVGPTVLTELVEAVLETFSGMFGGAILIEIWSAAATDPDPETVKSSIHQVCENHLLLRELLS